MRCPQCGTENPSGSRFCETCGHDLANIPPLAEPPPSRPGVGDPAIADAPTMRYEVPPPSYRPPGSGRPPGGPGGPPPGDAGLPTPPSLPPARPRQRWPLYAGLAALVLVCIGCLAVAGLFVVNSVNQAATPTALVPTSTPPFVPSPGTGPTSTPAPPTPVPASATATSPPPTATATAVPPTQTPSPTATPSPTVTPTATATRVPPTATSTGGNCSQIRVSGADIGQSNFIPKESLPASIAIFAVVGNVTPPGCIPNGTPVTLRFLAENTPQPLAEQTVPLQNGQAALVINQQEKKYKAGRYTLQMLQGDRLLVTGTFTLT